MSSTSGRIGYGTTLAGSSLSTVVEVTNISGPSIEVDDIEFTNMDSTSARKEFLAGLVDSGTLDIEINYTKAQVAAVSSALRTSQTWTVTFTDSSTWTGTGYVKSLGQETPTADRISNTFSIKATGVWTFTAG
jgi:hypothetical protein